jgi:hypothetical protein
MRPRSVMFVTKDDGISVSHPNQTTLEFGAPRALAADPLRDLSAGAKSLSIS